MSYKAGTDYGTYFAAQPDAAAKNMMFASVDSQQTCCEHAMNIFRGRAVLLRNKPKIVGFQDEHKGIPCRRMLVWPSCGGRLCHKHFFSNFWTSCSWLPQRLRCRTRLIVCTGLYTNINLFFLKFSFGWHTILKLKTSQLWNQEQKRIYEMSIWHTEQEVTMTHFFEHGKNKVTKTNFFKHG